jgi:hypothetical protein
MRVNHSENSLGVRHFLCKGEFLSFVCSKTLYQSKRGVYCLDKKNKRLYLKQIEPTKVNGFVIEFVSEGN